MGRQSYIENIKEWESGFDFHVPITVRFYETDMFGHLNNREPFSYFETARIEFFKSLGLMRNWASPHHENIPVVADLQCDFLSQVFFDEELRIFVKINEVGNSSIDLHYMGKNSSGTSVFTGRGRIVQISSKTGKPAAWSETDRANLLASMNEYANSPG